ncbi:MAG: PAS domain S-box protein [Chloroflexi bacterium]|nr:PAS domain S-box protein [Chloroflexota bacterium]
MEDKLCLLVCEDLEREARSVIESEGLEHVALVTFPAGCGRLELQAMRNLLSDCREKYQRVHLLGGCCLSGSEELEAYRAPKAQTCFHLLQSRDFVDGYLEEGCYLVTPGWLANWRRYIDGWGFDRETARQFFGESASRLALLDTGVWEKTDENLREFSEFVGLPCQTVKIGFDFFRLALSRLVLEWRLSAAPVKTNPAPASYAMALDLVGGLTRPVAEREAIESIFDLFGSLFAPEAMAYLPVNNGAPGELQVRSRTPIDLRGTRARLAGFLGGSAWTESGAGFAMPIGGQSDVLGILEIDKLAFPEHREEYLNLALSLNHVCRMAIQNARTYESLERARGSLQESEQRWATTLSSIGDAVIATDMAGRVTFMNAVAEALTGWMPSEAAGRHITEIFNVVNEYTRERVENPAIRVIQEGVTVGLANHTVLVRKDGTEVAIDDSGAPIRDRYGTLRGVVLVFHDITERRKAEGNLRDREAELSVILESVPLLMMVVDSDRNVVRVNGAAERFAGHSAREMLGLRSGNALGCLHTWDDPRGCGFGPACQACQMRLTMLDTLETGKTHESVEWGLPFVRGSQREELFLRFSTIRLPTQKRQALICIEDITERKKLERMKDEFIGMVSHELRTPLTVIIGALTVATTPGVSEEDARELLQDAVAQSHELAAMVENLLELSRHQADRLTLAPESVDIGQVVGSVVDRLKGQSAIHQLTTDIPATLPGIRADRIRVERILYNLVHNGIKYSPSGGEVRIFAGQLHGDLIVGVRDHGIGITPEGRERLFQSFERLNEAGGRTIAGVGLGLRVCQLLVEAHGGRIWVESTPGRGATFFFTLPNRLQDRSQSDQQTGTAGPV